MLKLKAFFLVLIFASNAYSTQVVVVSKKINFKEKITAYNTQVMNVSRVKKNCIPASVEQLKSEQHIAKHYMKTGTIICTKDVKTYLKEKVVVKFGAIEIEKNGKLIYENDEYLRIKKEDGKIEKIYKDGRLQ